MVSGLGGRHLIVGADFGVMVSAACAHRFAAVVAARKVLAAKFAAALSANRVTAQNRSAAGENFVGQTSTWQLVSASFHL